MTNTSDDSNSAAAKVELAEIRVRLEAQIAALRASSSGGSAGISFGKRIGEGTSLAVERLTDVAVHDRLVEQLTAVRRAEEKVVDGTSESCDVCGAAIESERRQALVWAVTCMNCADGAVVTSDAPVVEPAVSSPKSTPTTDSPWHSALGTQLPSSGD